MCIDVDTAQSNNGGADKNEHEDNQDGDDDSEDLAANTDFVALPVDILRGGDLGVLD